MSALAPLIVVGVVVCTDLLVLTDARRQSRHGTPVIFRFGSFGISTPEAWAAACLLLFVIFVPLYAVSRHSDAP